MTEFWLCVAAIGALPAIALYNLIVWETTSETWAWIHERNRLTGEIRHIQKVRGVPMTPPKRPEGIPPPQRGK